MGASQSGLFFRSAVEHAPGVGLLRQTEVAGLGSDQVGVVLTDTEDLARDVHDGAMLLQEVTADEQAQAWAVHDGEGDSSSACRRCRWAR